MGNPLASRAFRLAWAGCFKYGIQNLIYFNAFNAGPHPRQLDQAGTVLYCWTREVRTLTVSKMPSTRQNLYLMLFSSRLYAKLTKKSSAVSF